MLSDDISTSKPVGKTRKSQSAIETRDRLLQAAISVIQTQGVERLTLDAVAKEAQVSKGGLLYHFASKEALVAGSIQYLLDDFDAAISAELDRDHAPDSPGKWLRAYVNATFNYGSLPTSLIFSLLSAVTINPELLKPVQRQFDDWQYKSLEKGLDPVRASLVRLATDGFGDAQLLGRQMPNETLRQQLLEMLLATIVEAESSDRG
jgi:AcrR family transcriptional regulator